MKWDTLWENVLLLLLHNNGMPAGHTILTEASIASHTPTTTLLPWQINGSLFKDEENKHKQNVNKFRNDATTGKLKFTYCRIHNTRTK